MESTSILLVLLFGLVAFSCELKPISARDAITANTSLSSDRSETLVSAGKTFELGFFKPGDMDNTTFLGIWYNNVKPRTVVWVANRDHPLLQVPGFLVIFKDGNVRLLDSKGDSYFYTDVPNSSVITSRTLRLLDSGNLVLFDNGSGPGKYLWQSFTRPSDTFLPGMVMDENLELVSWMGPNNPVNGKFSFQKDQENSKLLKIMERSSNYWRSDYSDSADLPIFFTNFLSNTNLSNTSRKGGKNPGHNYNINQSSNFDYSKSRLLMNYSGEIQFYTLVNNAWLLLWSEPHDGCSVYKACGSFGLCSIMQGGVRRCECPQGFDPVSPENWKNDVFYNGCERKTPTCNKNPTRDQFLSLKLMSAEKSNTRIPGVHDNLSCRQECIRDCQSPCEAYYYKEYIGLNLVGGCWIWTSDLNNLEEYGTSGSGHDLFIRFSNSTIEPICNSSLDCQDWPESNCSAKQDATKRCFCNSGYRWDGKALKCISDGSKATTKASAKPSKLVIIGSTLAGVILLTGSIGCFFYGRRKGGKKEMILGNPESYERDDKDLVDEDNNIADLAYFSLESILEATQNFSDSNKLGQGGFGPVYKGMFPGGQEIAVKRLLSQSGQGMDEFRNEVVTIAKLQHRNLVRLLGYCIKGPERLLLYEYMPNTSLDTFIFDQERCVLLDWSLRFDIILGIARGLLYLHQDSRLRIIHRDLKTSNILLDEHMNPKISDFGLARVFAGKEIEANTMRVVGTYGYMSPEYAQAGFYSVKSDVFSFGVILLEIISGKRNTGFYNSEAMSLLGYAWRLWEGGNAISLVDDRISQSSKRTDVIKCIKTGLLCVQDDPSDRPTMSNVLHMLVSEVTTTLPSPKEPGFVPRKFTLSGMPASTSSQAETWSASKMSTTLPIGR